MYIPRGRLQHGSNNSTPIPCPSQQLENPLPQPSNHISFVRIICESNQQGGPIPIQVGWPPSRNVFRVRRCTSLSMAARQLPSSDGLRNERTLAWEARIQKGVL